VKKPTGPSSSTVRAFVARGLAAQAAVDRAIAKAAAPAPASPEFPPWQRCGGGPGQDCQAWARGDRGCPRHRKRGSVSSR
jgi:hypothetical protein